MRVRASSTHAHIRISYFYTQHIFISTHTRTHIPKQSESERQTAAERKTDAQPKSDTPRHAYAREGRSLPLQRKKEKRKRKSRAAFYERPETDRARVPSAALPRSRPDVYCRSAGSRTDKFLSRVQRRRRRRVCARALSLVAPPTFAQLTGICPRSCATLPVIFGRMDGCLLSLPFFLSFLFIFVLSCFFFLSWSFSFSPFCSFPFSLFCSFSFFHFLPFFLP